MTPFVDVAEKSFSVETPQGQGNTTFNSVGIGTGSKVFRADSSGIWLGAAEFGNAPFRVDMNGNATASSLTITGYIPTGGAAADVNASVTTINASKINISGSTTFSAGYDPTTKVASTAGNYESATSGARVRIFPNSGTTGIDALDSGGSLVFRVQVGNAGGTGGDSGDVILGKYTSGRGVLWDNSAGTLKIKGDIEAGDINGVNITGSTISGTTYQTGASGTTRVEIDSGTDSVDWIGSDNNTRLQIITSSSSPARGIIQTQNGYQLRLISSSGTINCDGDNLDNIGTVTATTFSGTGSFSSISMSGDIDMNTQSVREIDALNFIQRSSTPSDAGSWGQWAHSSGGTFQMRVRLNGANYSQNLSNA